MSITVVDALPVVKRVAPGARSNYLKAIENAEGLFAQHELTTPLRMAHFLAQALHETGGFTILRESMHYSANRLMEIFGVGRHSAAITSAEAAALAGNDEAIAERVYGLGNPRKADELGNSRPGDGFRYRGNGILQTTGRGAHRSAGRDVGIDFEGDPDLVTSAEHALKPALFEWTENNLNRFADMNDIRTITRKINGGFNGLDDRQMWLNKVFPLLNGDKELTDPMTAAAPDPEVKELQEALNALGASPQLTADGRYGPATSQAVKQFQALAGLPQDGIAGPVTLAALKLRAGARR